MQSLTIAGNVGPVRLSDLLDHNPESGKLFWLSRSRDLFVSLRGCRTWNARYPGSEALTALDGCGYLMGRIFGRPFKAHRVIWALEYDRWPPDQIDHINGNRADNRIKNLREVTQSQNNMNMARRSDNKSGQVGVCFDATRGRWMAYANTKIIGRFQTQEEAAAAREATEFGLGFTERHGRVQA